MLIHRMIIGLASIMGKLWKGRKKKRHKILEINRERGEMAKIESVFPLTTKGGLSASPNVELLISCAEGMKVNLNSKKMIPVSKIPSKHEFGRGFLFLKGGFDPILAQDICRWLAVLHRPVRVHEAFQ